MKYPVVKFMRAICELFNSPCSRKLTGVKINKQEFSEKHLRLKTALKYSSATVLSHASSHTILKKGDNLPVQLEEIRSSQFFAPYYFTENIYSIFALTRSTHQSVPPTLMRQHRNTCFGCLNQRAVSGKPKAIFTSK